MKEVTKRFPDHATIASLMVDTREQWIDIIKKVEDAGLDIASSGKKTALCKEHYKEWKKETKGDRDLERSRYDRF